MVHYVRQLLSGGDVIHHLKGIRDDKVKRKKLKPIAMEEIGVIASYRAQCKVLRTRFVNEGWTKLKVGTIDSFQGEERSVIIASTVRTNSNQAAFLRDPRVIHMI